VKEVLGFPGIGVLLAYARINQEWSLILVLFRVLEVVHPSEANVRRRRLEVALRGRAMVAPLSEEVVRKESAGDRGRLLFIPVKFY
jgi:hypothetical protein